MVLSLPSHISIAGSLAPISPNPQTLILLQQLKNKGRVGFETEFPWLIGSLFMPKEGRNNNPPHMYVILYDFFKKCFHICNFIYSSLHHWEEGFIKDVKSSGYRAQICVFLSVAMEINGNFLGLFMGHFPNVKYNSLGPTLQD